MLKTKYERAASLLATVSTELEKLLINLPGRLRIQNYDEKSS